MKLKWRGSEKKWEEVKQNVVKLDRIQIRTKKLDIAMYFFTTSFQVSLFN